MNIRSSSNTAELTAAVRAVETLFDDDSRFFYDPYALDLLTSSLRNEIKSDSGESFISDLERRTPGLIASVLCRTRFIDDALRDALSEKLDQVVILGAGFDSRAYRIPHIEQTQVFEVDHPATQITKIKRMKQILKKIPSHVIFVPIDFEDKKPYDALLTAGFHKDAQTFFIWEGVTSYLTAEAVDTTLRFMSQNSAPGSWIAFTYIHRGGLDEPTRFAGAEEVMRLVQELNEPLTFGFEPNELGSYLAARGLKLVEDNGTQEYQSRYLDMIGRGLTVSNLYRDALVRVWGS